MYKLATLVAVLAALTASEASPVEKRAPAAHAVGLGWNQNSGKQASAFQSVSGSKFSWYYDWDYTGFTYMGNLEYVPMVWGNASVTKIGAASSNFPSGSYILGFNEPDQPYNYGGSQLTPAQGASLHQQWVSSLASGKNFLIGSPAVARGDGSWLDSWISACAGKCKYDFVPFHFYGTNANDLITYAQGFYKKYNKPLWLTEWACLDYSSGQVCTVAQAQSFMDTAISAFRNDATTGVARWAWFGAFTDQYNQPNGVENQDGTPNALGQHYVTL